MALHLCQLCVQFRMNFVDHSCGGGHPNHPISCGQKEIGAVACPFHLVEAKQPDDVSTASEPVVDDVLSLTHSPSFACDCNGCGDFFFDLQAELDSYQVDCDIEDQWINLHFPKEDASSEDECVSDDDDITLCSECNMSSSLPSSTLCHGCDTYFGGVEGLAAYERELQMETSFSSESYSSSGDESTCSSF